MTPTAEPTLLSDLIAQFFCFGVNGGDARWGTYAWHVLAGAGVVPAELDEDDPTYAEHLVSLAALAHLSDCFNDTVGGGWPDHTEPADVTDGPDALAEIALGRYAERHGVHTDEWPETATQLSEACVRHQMPSIAHTLATAVGGTSSLFADLRAQPRSRDSDDGSDGDPIAYPLSDALRGDILSAPTVDDARAFEWLTQLVESAHGVGAPCHT